jgi:hypothetical protein
LAIRSEQVGLKAKTGEQVGAVGRQEIIAAQCVVLLSPLPEGEGIIELKKETVAHDHQDPRL